MLNGLDLFSGIGGLSLALNEWVRPIAYCEIDTYCQGILLSRMASGDLVHAPIWDDIKRLRIRKQEVDIDIIYGGFPCQDISVAGHGKGLEGERSGLFFEILRLAKEIKPCFIFLENVPAITTRGGLQVVREVAEMGYDCRWCVISAASVGALHRRERWFLLAHANNNGTSSCEYRGSTRKRLVSWKEAPQSKESFRKIERTSSISADVANTNGQRCNTKQGGESIRFQEKNTKSSISNIENGCYSDSEPSQQTDTLSESKQDEERTWRRSTGQHWPFESREHWQEVVSSMGKCSDGLSYHVDRLRGLGNAVVPKQAKEAFKILMGLK